MTSSTEAVAATATKRKGANIITRRVHTYMTNDDKSRDVVGGDGCDNAVTTWEMGGGCNASPTSWFLSAGE